METYIIIKLRHRIYIYDFIIYQESKMGPLEGDLA